MNIPEEDQEQQDNITVDCESLPEQNQNDEFTTVASKKKRKKRNKKNGENNNDTNNE